MNEQQMYAPTEYRPKSQQEIDSDNLSTLAVCHYVAGAVIAVFSCMFLFYIFIGAIVARVPVTAVNQAQYSGPQPSTSTEKTEADGTDGQSGSNAANGSDGQTNGSGTSGSGSSTSPRGGSNPPFPFNPGYIFVIFGSVGVLVGWTGAVLTIIAGRCISKRKNYVFILIVAGLGCAFMNLINTTLGVFTFIVLLRPTVKVLFEGQRL